MRPDGPPEAFFTRPESTLQVRPIPVPSPSTVDVLGIPLALTDYDEMLDWIDGMVASRRRGYLCACNVHTVMASREDDKLRDSLMSASFNVPDVMSAAECWCTIAAYVLSASVFVMKPAAATPATVT